MAPCLKLLGHEAPTSKELELGDYFRSSAFRLFPDELNAEFWQQSVLQASRSVPAIWHASNALGGSMWCKMSRNKGQLDVAERLSRDSLRQSSMSLQHTLTMAQSPWLSAQDKALILLSNALLSLCIWDTDDRREWHSLRGSSFQLIRCWRFWETIDSGPTPTLATQILYYFIKGERMFYESQLETPAKPLDTWDEAIAWLQKYPLTSAIRAYIELEMIWSSVRSIIESLPFNPTGADIASASTRRTALGLHFAVWESRYHVLLSSAAKPDPQRRMALNTRRILLGVLLRLDLTRCTPLWDETCWDEFHTEYSKVVDIVAGGLAEIERIRAGARAQNTRWFTPLLWNALNFVARACREPQLRHRAASLLHSALVTVIRIVPPTVASDAATPSESPDSLLVVTGIMAMEEGAHGECHERKKCRRGEFVCNMHRVARVHAARSGAKTRFTARTVGDILNNRSGQNIDVGQALAWG